MAFIKGFMSAIVVVSAWIVGQMLQDEQIAGYIGNALVVLLVSCSFLLGAVRTDSKQRSTDY